MSGYPDYPDVGMSEYSGYPDFRTSKYTDFQISGYLGIRILWKLPATYWSTPELPATSTSSTFSNGLLHRLARTSLPSSPAAAEWLLFIIFDSLNLSVPSPHHPRGRVEERIRRGRGVERRRSGQSGGGEKSAKEVGDRTKELDIEAGD